MKKCFKRIFKKTEENQVSDLVKENMKDFRCKFYFYFLIGFLAVILITYLIGKYDWISQNFNFTLTEKPFEILVTIIGFLGVMLGFILTALGVIISSVQNRYQNETKAEEKTKINDYWIYLIKASKNIAFILLFYILIFIVLISLIETIENYNGILCLISWSILSTIMIWILIFSTIFKYYENPFE